MKNLSKYRFIVGMVSIVSGVLALACILVGAMAVEYNFDAFSDPVLTLQYAHHYELAKWFNLLDLFGYYLFLLPLVFYFHQQYKYRSPWTSLFTFSGAAYVLIGALGAAILAALWPHQMLDYIAASDENTGLAIAMFETTTLIVTKGMWNILEVLFAAVWWIGLGNLLLSESKIIGIFTIITGLSTLLDATGNIFSIQSVADLGLNSYLILGIVWPVAIGISLVRRSVQLQSQAKTLSAPEASQTNYEHV
jgi:hypothetical protein